MRSLTPGLPYLRHMMQTMDIIAVHVSEHGLFECQLWKLNDANHNFNVTAKASKGLKDDMCNRSIGHSGVALFWKESLSQFVKPVKDIESDRMCAMDIMLPNARRVRAVSVYLPYMVYHRASLVADYAEELALLEKLS